MPGPLSQQHELPVKIGELLVGKYRIERILGHGGMGIVVAAMHEQLQELVAIKLLLSNVGNRPDFVQRFVREARAAVKIKSAHVARVLDVDSLPDGRLYMVMEYLDGQDLGQLLDSRGACSVNEAVDYVLQVCEALAEAHALGIVHRDIKPSNLFVTQTPTGAPLVKVLDFGISKVTGALAQMGAEKQDGRLTGETALIGSPLYMSPEQIRSAKDVDGRTDVWSLGVILHELLSNKTPFYAESHVALLASIAADPPVPLREHVPDAPPEIEAIILRCLEKDPAKRIQSVLELARALGPYAHEDAVPSVERALRSAGRTSGNFSRARQTPRTSPTPLTPLTPTDRTEDRVSIPVGGADAMADTLNTLTEASPEKRSYRAVAAATALGGLVAVGVAALLAVRAPLSDKPEASGASTTSSTSSASPTASAQSARPVEEPLKDSAPSPTSALSDLPAPPVVSAVGVPPSGPSAVPDAGAPDASGGSSGKPGASTPSHSFRDGGIRLGKEVDSRH